ncbi:phospholipid-binding protein MlaC [Oceaniserpentilla sp. 4NH20-0058]|uniref:MlaC/ttg2D family ABC transporter substrate-binding protein n=1 Tax=Oceaniserpentilla sp. 4NH20-0058 TaxID=3127660 RepID=UPI003108F454
MFRFLSTMSLLLALVLPAQAQDTNPKSVVKSVSDVVLSEILENKPKLEQGPEFLLNLVESHMLPIIDQERMSKLALGQHWSSINDEQKVKFTEGFKRLLVKTYAGAFKAYTGQDVTYGDTRFNKTKDKAIVTSYIHVAGGSPVNLQYRLYQKSPTQWLVYDATIAGLGLIRTYRAQFNDQIARDGIDATIAQLNAVEL